MLMLTYLETSVYCPSVLTTCVHISIMTTEVTGHNNTMVPYGSSH